MQIIYNIEDALDYIANRKLPVKAVLTMADGSTRTHSGGYSEVHAWLKQISDTTPVGSVSRVEINPPSS